jgi:hypothetical protein
LNKRHLISALTLVLGLFVLVQPARAITLIPPSLEYGAKPGEKISATIKLFNETATPLTLYSSTDNFTSGDQEGTPNFTNTPKEGLASWITVSEATLTLAPGERKDVPVEINVPANADPGGHYAAVFFGDNPEATGNGTIAVGNKVGTLVLLRVDGTIREAGRIASFNMRGNNMVLTRLPASFDLNFENQGNVHVRPTGTVTIRNVLGGTSTELTMNASSGAVLPNSQRTFSVDWEKGTDTAERGSFFTEIAREWNNFGLGPYTASVDLEYGIRNDKTTSATVRFWIFPWQLLLVSALALTFVIVLLVWGIRRYNTWVISKAAGQNQKKS